MTLEELQAEFLKQKEQLQQLTEDNKKNKLIIEEKTKREKELEEHNQKLFLRVTTPVATKEDIKEDNKDIIDFVGEKLYKELTDKDIDNIKIILEGEDV